MLRKVHTLLNDNLSRISKTADIQKLSKFLRTYNNNAEVIVKDHTSFAAPSYKEKLTMFFDLILETKPAVETPEFYFFEDIETLIIQDSASQGMKRLNREFTWEAEVLLAVKRYQQTSSPSFFSDYPAHIKPLLNFIEENRTRMQVVYSPQDFKRDFTEGSLKRLLDLHKLILDFKEAQEKGNHKITAAEKKLFKSLEASIFLYRELARGLLFLEENQLYSFYSGDLLDVNYQHAPDFAVALFKLNKHELFDSQFIRLIREPVDKENSIFYQAAADILIKLKQLNHLNTIENLLRKYKTHFHDYKHFLGIMDTLIKNHIILEDLLVPLLSNSHSFEWKAANFLKLHKHNILSFENIKIINIEDYIRAGYLYKFLTLLSKANLLDDKTRNLNTYLSTSELQIIVAKLKLFAKANMLTKPTLEGIYNKDKEVEEKYFILHLFAQYNARHLFTEENYKFIRQIKGISVDTNKRDRVIYLLKELDRGGSLNADTKEYVKDFFDSGPGYSLGEFIFLINTVCQNDPAHNAIEPPSSYIMTTFLYLKVLGSVEIGFLLWRIPPERINRNLLRSIFNTCRNEGTVQEKIASITRHLNRLINGEQITQPGEVNYGQSVHAASVEKSVVKSLEKLNKTYTEIDIEENYKEIIKFAKSLNPENYPNPEDFPTDTREKKAASNKEWALKLETAKRALTETLPKLLDCVEPKTHTSIKKILALVWEAIHDGEKLLNPNKNLEKNIPELISNALGKFIQHLYEIQAGYSLDLQGNRKESKDVSICVGGTINQLVTALDRVHEDVEIYFLSNTSVSLKAHSLISELVTKFIQYAPKEEKENLDMSKENPYRTSWNLSDGVIAYLKNLNFTQILKKELLKEYSDLPDELLDEACEQWKDNPPALKEPYTLEFPKLLHEICQGWEENTSLNINVQFNLIVNELIFQYIDTAPLEIKQQLIESFPKEITDTPIPNKIVSYLIETGTFQAALQQKLSQFQGFAPTALLTLFSDVYWQKELLIKGTVEKIVFAKPILHEKEDANKKVKIEITREAVNFEEENNVKIEITSEAVNKEDNNVKIEITSEAVNFEEEQDYEELLKQWPMIQSKEAYFIAKEKKAFIQAIEKNPAPKTNFGVLARHDLCEQIKGSDSDISLQEIVEKGSPFLSATLYLKKDNKVIATFPLEQALSPEDQHLVAIAKPTNEGADLITLSSQQTENRNVPKKIGKREQREIWRIRGEVEQQFGKECGLYYKRLFVTRDPKRDRLINEIYLLFDQALEEDWSLDAIKQELNDMGNEAQKHHESTSGFRFAGALFNKTCGFRIAIDKILAKFPLSQEKQVLKLT